MTGARMRLLPLMLAALGVSLSVSCGRDCKLVGTRDARSAVSVRPLAVPSYVELRGSVVLVNVEEYDSSVTVAGALVNGQWQLGGVQAQRLGPRPSFSIVDDRAILQFMSQVCVQEDSIGRCLKWSADPQPLVAAFSCSRRSAIGF